MKTINPIRHTVSHFVTVGFSLSRRNYERRVRKAKKKIKKSNFVCFMESLENRGGDHMPHHDFYRKWTQAVRAEMQASNKWLAPNDNASLAFVADYLCRLLAAFWAEHPDLDWKDGGTLQEHHEELLPYRRMLWKIFKKIRAKGIRDKTYRLDLWQFSSPIWLVVRRHPRQPYQLSIGVRPGSITP